LRPGDRTGQAGRGLLQTAQDSSRRWQANRGFGFCSSPINSPSH